MRELVLHDRETVFDQIRARADLDEPEDEVLRDRRRSVLGGDAVAPLGANAVRGRCQWLGHAIVCGRGGLHDIFGGHSGIG